MTREREDGLREWQALMTRIWREHEQRNLRLVKWYRPWESKFWREHALWFAQERLAVDRHTWAELTGEDLGAGV